MPPLNLICLLSILCLCWLLLRLLYSYSVLMRFIIIGLCAVLFFRPLIGEGFFLFPAIIFENIIMISAFMLLLNKLRDKETKIIFTSSDKIFLLFILMLVISLVRTVNLSVSINQLIYFLSIYLFYWSIRNLPDDTLIKEILLKTFIASGLLLIIYAVHQYTIGFSQMREFLEHHPEHIINSAEFIKRVKQNLIFATFIYPPAFGDYLNMLLLSLFGLSYIQVSADQEKNEAGILGKCFPLMLMLIILPVLILTKSKGAWVSLFFALAFLRIMNNQSIKSKLKPVHAAGLFIVCFLGIGLFSKISLPGFNNFIISGNIRLEYWKSTIMMIKDYPVWGFGPGTFGIVYPLFKTKLAEETIMAHNSFLQLWAESGFPALLCFVLFCGNIFKRAFKSRVVLKPIELGLLAAFFSFIVQNFFDFGIFDAQRATVAFGLIGLYSLHRSNESKNLVIHCKRAKVKIAVFCGLFLLLTLIYSANIYLARHFDASSGLALKKGHIEEAVNFSKLALRHNPLKAEYFYHHGYIFEHIARQNHSNEKLRTEASAQAVSNYQAALKLNPFAAYYHLRLGKLLFLCRQENYEQNALFHIKMASEMYPLNPVYHEQLAEFYAIIGKSKEKESELEKSRELRKYFKKGTRN